MKKFLENGSFVNLDNCFCMLFYRGYASVMIVQSRTASLLLQLLMDQVDSLQYI